MGRRPGAGLMPRRHPPRSTYEAPGRGLSAKLGWEFQRMESRRLGQSGVDVSVLGLGTWPMGGEWWGGTDDAESIRTIHRALDLGVTLFDTAEAYAAGHAEEVLGRGLVGRRQQAVIADKVAPDHFAPEQI